MRINQSNKDELSIAIKGLTLELDYITAQLDGYKEFSRIIYELVEHMPEGSMSDAEYGSMINRIHSLRKELFKLKDRADSISNSIRLLKNSKQLED